MRKFLAVVKDSKYIKLLKYHSSDHITDFYNRVLPCGRFRIFEPEQFYNLDDMFVNIKEITSNIKPSDIIYIYYVPYTSNYFYRKVLIKMEELIFDRAKDLDIIDQFLNDKFESEIKCYSTYLLLQPNMK